MKTFIVIPTYNESSNIEALIEQISAQRDLDLHVVIVDDDSPDGTGRLVSSYLAKMPQLYLIERVGLRSRGSAVLSGFEFALKSGADRVVEMDADFSHPPGDIPRLLAALDLGGDVAIGSRLVEGASDNRVFGRKIMTLISNSYARFWLQKRTHSEVVDWTSNFRAYRKEVFEKVKLSTLAIDSPTLGPEILFRALNAGCKAVEVPFVMKDRELGVSTFKLKAARQSLRDFAKLRLFGKIKKTKGPGPLEDLELTASEPRRYRLQRKVPKR